MQQRNSGNRRPSGTDGSDFSYRMVVDNRYTKVAKGKSIVSKILIIQAVVLLVGVLYMLFTFLTKQPLDSLAAASTFLTFISIMIGELGRKRSRANLLKFYIVASTLGVLGSIVAIFLSDSQLKVLNDPSIWETEKVVLLRIAYVSIGLFVQIYSVTATISLIGNMSPPKRAS